MSANPDFVYQPPMSPYLDIIYLDQDLLVLNKPSGLLTVPGRLAEHQDCLQTRVQRVLPTATIVHRLDMATSGIIIMALNKQSHVAISRQFEKRQTEKYYLARVYGQLQQKQGSVDLPLICDWPNRPKQMVCHERGKQALTHYKVLDEQREYSLLELKPITGRSHQLRVHMLSLGHPILGDRLYAHASALALAERLQLHSRYYAIYHPKTGEQLEFLAPCPFT
ncbi:bifunctional tRNA pseudouridine(32) synthase/23S rRNA pseudouridine(746) synthase RluA [Thalassotalea sp. HSM 43]|uniref:bifunctional tRNA pseudouridine(32) synthase/23S rRNA pseudouridine(746) synthase RluA n=1 Tax=Thalassotalea sp. HSM 43 TaxID=2552945 RepID=UPI0010821014|nr:bifunctional tRNA pseudouridine(32) synthase/23S rRNA pseudouridine(746) synthase RluA [Thalassotalea sp. HSM 43]QBY04876.1 bifunctional tRNA pseudouridine(32) synthase/23S rRNA pseudouridine(746) synthase RluA [Thalassotalea sp. HSM 43]